MPPKKNPLNLNRLQLKTLVILQELARDPDVGMADADGNVAITQLPHAHGDHFHVGRHVVRGADATGISNQAVWVALERKGLLARALFPVMVSLSPAGLAYETGIAQDVLLGGDH